LVASVAVPTQSGAGLGGPVTTIGVVEGGICYAGQTCGFVDPQRFHIGWTLYGGFAFKSRQYIGTIFMGSAATYQGVSRATLDPFSFSDRGLDGRRISGSCTGSLTFPGPTISLRCTGKVSGGKVGTQRFTINGIPLIIDISGTIFAEPGCVCEDFTGVYTAR
jgi:hypothetical protein